MDSGGFMLPKRTLPRQENGNKNLSACTRKTLGSAEHTSNPEHTSNYEHERLSPLFSDSHGSTNTKSRSSKPANK
jgi:hypothetical protein